MLPASTAGRRDIRWFFDIHHVCVVSLYLIFLTCIFLNVYVLLSREDTVYHLRIYHSVAGLLMLCCMVVQMEFLFRTRRLPKLEEPHEIPRPALIGAIALTLGIALGYLYFIIFNYAFQDCDKLVDAVYDSELWLESIYDVMMSLFSLLSLGYVLQRRYYGAINSSLDKVGRLFINITFAVVWIKVVVYKGYTSHQELCQRKELEGYWCPVMKRKYDCSPSDDLHGTQKMWYYINKGILSTAIISCASEFFPVLLVAHWLACGGAEERAEDMLKRERAKQGLRGMMKEFVKDVSRVYVADHKMHVEMLDPSVWLTWSIGVLVPVTAMISVARWLAFFYYAIDFDELVHNHWQTSDFLTLASNILQLLFFAIVYRFTLSVENSRLDAHHKAHARGDIGILFGCSCVLFVKTILQSIENEYQHVDGFIVQADAIVKIANILTVHITQWIQYLSLRRLLAMSTMDLLACKSFLPLAGAAGLLFSWVHFGCTYLDTTLIKYQLTDETYRFSDVTLICMIFTQTIFPAEYLYAFTASGCYLELLQRYLEIGFFQLGPPRLDEHESHALEQLLEVSRKHKRFADGDHIATILHANRIIPRRRVSSASSTELSTDSTDSIKTFPLAQ